MNLTSIIVTKPASSQLNIEKYVQLNIFFYAVEIVINIKTQFMKIESSSLLFQFFLLNSKFKFYPIEHFQNWAPLHGRIIYAVNCVPQWFTIYDIFQSSNFSSAFISTRAPHKTTQHTITAILNRLSRARELSTLSTMIACCVLQRALSTLGDNSISLKRKTFDSL